MAGGKDRSTGAKKFTSSVDFQKLERAERENRFSEKSDRFYKLERMENESNYTANRLALSRIADEAYKYCGYKYEEGAEGEDDSIDCSGLVYRAIKDSGYNPNIERKQAIDYREKEWSEPISETRVLKGDLVHFGNTRTTAHVGIVYNRLTHEMISAVSEGNNPGVHLSNYKNLDYWTVVMYTRPKRR